MKLSEFLGFGKKKVNETPAIPMPTQEQLTLTKNLRDYALRGEGFEGKGYGEGFLSKATNPVIANKEAMFREQTLPGIQNQLSSRGVARSAGSGLATDMVLRAEAQKNRDIDELMSKFYVLNEQQKKSDQSQMLRTATGLQDQEAGMLENRAAASERQAIRDTSQNNAFNAQQDANLNRTVSAALGAATGGSTGGWSGALSGAQAAVSPTYASGTSAGGTTQSILGQSGTPEYASNLQAIEAYLRQKGLIK